MVEAGKRIARGFWLLWVSATVAGWSAGSVVSDTLGDAVDEVWFDSLGLIVLGILIGGMQWLVLRYRVSWAGWWVVANIAGWSIGAVINVPWGLAAGWIVGVVVACAFQWLVMRRRMSRAGWWVPANMVSWAVGTGGAVAVGVAGAASGVVFGAIVGAMTGVALIWLFRQPGPEEALKKPAPGIGINFADRSG